jgi:hypothetical protein
MRALFSLNLTRNNIDADGVASIAATLKRHAIEHQRSCISIHLGDQDQHLLARTKDLTTTEKWGGLISRLLLRALLKDLRALLVATSNLNPSHCMPAISAYLLKEIAEWL